MAETRDWQRNRKMWIQVLERQTGKSLKYWNGQVKKQKFKTENALRKWLTGQNITGYGQTILVMEQFGYPDFFLADAAKLIDQQYADRKHLQPIYNAIISAADKLGEVAIQARKTYVSLVGPRKTFARIQSATKDRVDLHLRIDNQKPGGRLLPSRINENMRLQIQLKTVADFDDEAFQWLKKAYEANN